MRKFTGTIILVITALIWGFAFVAQRYGAGVLDGYSFSELRYVIATVALAAFVGVSDLISKKKGRKRIGFNRDTIVGGIICGVVLAFSTLSQQLGIEETEAGKAGFITALYIVIVPFMSVLIGHKTTTAGKFAIVIAIAGFWLMCINGDSGITKGEILILLCAFAFSLQIVFIDLYAGKADALKFNFVQFATAAVVGFPFMAANGFPSAGAIADGIIPLLYLGVLSSAVAYTLQVAGQKRVSPSTSTLIMSLESVFSLIGGALILHEQNTAKELLGCLLVFIAVFAAGFSADRTFLVFDEDADKHFGENIKIENA